MRARPETIARILRLHPERLAPGRLTHVLFRHDEWCPALRGELCACSPDVELYDEWPPEAT